MARFEVDGDHLRDLVPQNLWNLCVSSFWNLCVVHRYFHPNQIVGRQDSCSDPPHPSNPQTPLPGRLWSCLTYCPAATIGGENINGRICCFWEAIGMFYEGKLVLFYHQADMCSHCLGCLLLEPVTTFHGFWPKMIVAIGLHDHNSEFKTLPLSALCLLQAQGASELLPLHRPFWVAESRSGAVPETSPTFWAKPQTHDEI